MTLGSDLAAELPGLRAQATSRMTETVRFFTTTTELNETTLENEVVETTLGTSVARVKFTSVQGSDGESANQHVVVQRIEVHVPVGSVNAPVNSWVRVTASTSDALLVGNVYRVTERPSAGQATAWRYAVEEVS